MHRAVTGLNRYSERDASFSAGLLRIAVIGMRYEMTSSGLGLTFKELPFCNPKSVTQLLNLLPSRLHALQISRVAKQSRSHVQNILKALSK